MCKQVKKREVNIDYSIYYVYGKLIIDNKIVDNNSNYTVIVNYTNGAYSVINEIDESKEYDGNIVQDENKKFEYKNKMDEDYKEAWQSYLKLCRLSASDYFENLFKHFIIICHPKDLLA